MLEPFQLPFVQHGIVEVLILAVAGGLIGTWIVLRGLAFYAHAVGTAAFPGLVLAEGLGFAAVARRRSHRSARGRRRRPAGPPRGRARPLRLAHGARPRRRAGGRRDPRQRRLPLRGRASSRCSSAACCWSTPATTPSPPVSAVIVVARRLRARAALAGDGLRPGLRARPRRALGAARHRAARPGGARRRRRPVDARRPAGHRPARRPGGHHAAGLLAPAPLAAGDRRARRRRGRRRAVAVGRGQRAARAGHRRARRRRLRRGGRGPRARRAPAAPPPRWRPPRWRWLALAGCATNGGGAAPGQAKVVATTTQIGDFARAVGGDRAKVVQLLQPNTDPARLRAAARATCWRRPTRTSSCSTATTSTAGWATSSRQRGGDPAIVDLGARVPVKVAGRERRPRGRALRPALVARPAQRAGRGGGDPRRADEGQPAARATSTRATPRPTWPGCARSTRDRRAAWGASRPPPRKLVTDHDAFGYFAAPLRRSRWWAR